MESSIESRESREGGWKQHGESMEGAAWRERMDLENSEEFEIAERLRKDSDLVARQMELRQRMDRYDLSVFNE